MKSFFCQCGLLLLLSASTWAQVDSVTVSGRIANLTPRLYRQSPNVLVSRNNLLQPNVEFTRPAPLNPDGTYSVKMPIIFGQEEMYFTFGPVSTAFLAAPGAISINLNADSLFQAAIPFQFGGVNARVNAQFARYKAFEAKQPKLDNARLSRNLPSDYKDVFSRVFATYNGPFVQFAQTVEKPFPLVRDWVTGINRYNAASFLYDMASYTGRKIGSTLEDTLRPPDDPILTAARTTSLDRLANYVLQLSSAQTLPVGDMATLLLRYGKNLADDERAKLSQWQTANSARAVDLRTMQRMVARNPDTLQRVMNYQLLLNHSKSLVDPAFEQTLVAFWLGAALPTLTINRSRLLYEFARSKLPVAEVRPRLIQSLDELYRLAVADSVVVRQAVRALGEKKGGNMEISPGIFVSRDDEVTGQELLERWLKTNRSRLVYVLTWSPGNDVSRRMIPLVNQLRDLYSPSELSVLLVGNSNDNDLVLTEYIVRNKLKGDHIFTSDTQNILPPFATETGALLIDRSGKVLKTDMPLPDKPDELQKQIDRRLR